MIRDWGAFVKLTFFRGFSSHRSDRDVKSWRMDVGGKFTATLSNLSISMYSQCQGACCWGHDDDIQNMQNMQYITQWLYTEYAIYAMYNMMMNIKYTIYAIYTMVTMIFIQCSSVCVFMSLKSDPPYCCWYININYQSKKNENENFAYFPTIY